MLLSQTGLRASLPSPDACRRARGPGGGLLAAWLACASLVLSGCGERGGPTAQGPGQPGGGPPPAMQVTVVEARPIGVPLTVEAVGQTEGSREVEVRARVTGVLERQFHRDGEFVRAGTPLFAIDRAPFVIALEQARAALAQETANLEQARREAARLAPLAEQRAVSRKEADDARSTQARIEAARRVAQARVRQAELDLSYTRVGAPISGITGRAERSQGSLVDPGANGLLTRITASDPIRVRFSLSQSEWEALRARKARAAVTLVLPDGRVHPVEGSLDFAGSTVDARLGTVPMRATFRNPDLSLLPGQFVRARVRIGEREAVLVPQPAVQTSEQGRYVWVVGPQGTAQRRPVRVGSWSGPDWAIHDGLVPGDRIIVDNLLKLRPGAPVAPSPAAAAATAGGQGPGAPGDAARNAAGGAAR